MSRWGPTPQEERWLEVGQRFRELPRDEITRRAGGWRAASAFARIALFVLGVVSAALGSVIVGLQRPMLLIGGLAAVAAAEWLKASRRLHASGFEEGLSAAGWLMVAIWFAGEFPSVRQQQLLLLIGGSAVAFAGLRLLSPFLTTCGAVALLQWSSSTIPARAFDQFAGPGAFAFALACTGATLALVIGAHVYRRPSFDHVFDWLVVVLPVAGFWHRIDDAPWNRVASGPGSDSTHVVTALVLVAVSTAMLASAIRRRRHAPLLGALACAACAVTSATRLVTWPAEAWLIATGLVAIALAAWADRRLRTARDGITSARIEQGEGIMDLVQTAATATVTVRLGQSGNDVEVPASGQGGRFGGGGASGSY
jgi:hypothetical protein